ncbi:MAG: S8 family serine peptidase, partial [Nitrospinota bacterium]
MNEGKEGRKRNSRALWVLGAAAGAAILGVAVFFLFFSGSGTKRVPLADLRVPDVKKAVEVPTSSSPIIPDELLVLLKGGKTVAEFRRSLTGGKVKVVGSIPGIGLVQVEVPAAEREAIKARLEGNPNVRLVVYQAVFRFNAKLNDPALTNRDPADDWGLRAIGAEAAWDVTRGSRRTVIAVVDAGVLVDHEELRGKIVSPASVFERSGRQKGSAKWLLHGTHVAITAAGSGDNGVGTSGVCPGCSVMPVQVLGTDGGAISDILNGVYYAIVNGARVVNLSVGKTFTSGIRLRYKNPRTRESARRRLTREREKEQPFYDRVLRAGEEAGVTIVAGAGNDDLPGDFNPLCYSRYTLCVGAAGLTAKGELVPAAFSNYGHLVQVSAPGVKIYSGSAEPGGGGYVFLNGTSMAAPHVSGLAGLIASAKPDLHPRDIRLAIIAGALDESGAPKARVRWVLQKGTAGRALRRWIRAFTLLLGRTEAPPKADGRLLQVLLSLIPDEYVRNWYALAQAGKGEFRRGVIALDEKQMKLARRVKRASLVRVYEFLPLVGSYSGASKRFGPDPIVGPFRLTMKAPYKRLEVVRKKDPGDGYAEWLEFDSARRFRHFARYGGKDYGQGEVGVRRVGDFLIIEDLKTGGRIFYPRARSRRAGAAPGGNGPRRVRSFVPPPFCTLAGRCEGGDVSIRTFGAVKDKRYPLQSAVVVLSGGKKVAEASRGSEFKFLLRPGAYRVRVTDLQNPRARRELDFTLGEGETVRREVSFPKGSLFLRTFKAQGKPLTANVYVYSGKKEVAKSMGRTRFGFLLSAGAYRVRVVDSSAQSTRTEFGVAIQEGEVIRRDVKLAKGTLVVRAFMAEGKPLYANIYVF